MSAKNTKIKEEAPAKKPKKEKLCFEKPKTTEEND